MVTADDSAANTAAERGGAPASLPGVSAAGAYRRLQQLQWAVAATAAAMIALAGLRLWFVDGLLQPAMIDGPSMAPALCGAHFEVTCSDCGVRFRCDAEHVPDDRRAACPNCGFTDNR